MIAEVQARLPAKVTAQRSDGEASLIVKCDLSGRTRVADLHQRANAKIRLPKTHDEHLRAVLINTSGGLTGGDRLKWTIEAAACTRTTVTTQAAERAYRSAGDEAQVVTRLKVGANASLAWLPHETILYDGSALKRAFHVELHDGATFLAAETLVLGRQAMRENLTSGRFRDRWRVYRSGHPVHADDIAMDFSGSQFLSAAATGGRHVLATLVFARQCAEDEQSALLDALNEIKPEHVKLGASALPERLTVRIAGHDNQAVKSALAACVDCLLPEASVDAVWNS